MENVMRFGIEILQKRIIESRRNQILKEAKEAHREFDLGLCKPVTPDELINQIIS